jgi:hypothetical protein
MTLEPSKEKTGMACVKIEKSVKRKNVSAALPQSGQLGVFPMS